MKNDMNTQDKQNRMFIAAIFVMVIVILLNSILLARAVGFIHFPGEMTRENIAREASQMNVEYYEQMAEDAGVINNSAVRDVLAQMKFEIDNAGSPEEIIQVQNEYGEKIRDVIQRERDNLREEFVLSEINSDPNIAEFQGEAAINISRSEDEGVFIDDKLGILSEDTKETIREAELMSGSWPLIELKVSDGKADIVTARTLIDRLRLYETEVEDLRSEIEDLKVKAGFAELSGSGIIVELYDADEGYSTVDIVHDRDIRDVVNELFAAGAEGVAIGDERLTATTSIRCAGPTVLVNQNPVAVNPIIVKAVGEPDILASSLDLIKAQLQEYGLKVEISQEEEISLPEY